MFYRDLWIRSTDRYGINFTGSGVSLHSSGKFTATERGWGNEVRARGGLACDAEMTGAAGMDSDISCDISEG